MSQVYIFKTENRKYLLTFDDQGKLELMLNVATKEYEDIDKLTVSKKSGRDLTIQLIQSAVSSTRASMETPSGRLEPVRLKSFLERGSGQRFLVSSQRGKTLYTFEFHNNELLIVHDLKNKNTVKAIEITCIVGTRRVNGSKLTPADLRETDVLLVGQNEANRGQSLKRGAGTVNKPRVQEL